ncbi:hypothetical protein D3C84_1123410 [compost metagenome]
MRHLRGWATSRNRIVPLTRGPKTVCGAAFYFIRVNRTLLSPTYILDGTETYGAYRKAELGKTGCVWRGRGRLWSKD